MHSLITLQGVQMKDIQNKIVISQKAFMCYTITNGNLQSFFSEYINFSVNFNVGLPW